MTTGVAFLAPIQLKRLKIPAPARPKSSRTLSAPRSPTRLPAPLEQSATTTL